MNRIVAVALAACWILAQAGPTAWAESGRFLMERVEDGFVRLDTQTGSVSLCQMRDDQIICRLSADERHAFEDTIAILEERVEKLEQRVAQGALPPPADDDVDRAMQAMEQMMRRFLGMIEEFDRRMGGEDGETQKM